MVQASTKSPLGAVCSAWFIQIRAGTPVVTCLISTYWTICDVSDSDDTDGSVHLLNRRYPFVDEWLVLEWRRRTDLFVGWWWWSSRCRPAAGWDSDAGRGRRCLVPGRETWTTELWAAEDCPLAVTPPTAGGKQKPYTWCVININLTNSELVK